MIPHNRLTFGAEEESATVAVIRSGQWACGPRVATLEARLAESFGFSEAVAVSSGLAALRLGLLALGAGRDDEVVVPAYSCVALGNATLSMGTTPVAADVGPTDWNLSATVARAALSGRTRAIIVVNTFGLPANVAELRDLGVPVIEDLSHGGTVAPDGDIRSQADVGVISFYASKLIGAGEGGAVLLRDAPTAARLRGWRDYADQGSDGRRLNEKMTDVEAALALCQLDRLPVMLRARSERAAKYASALAALASEKRLLLPSAEANRCWYRYAIAVPGVRAQTVVDALGRHGVAAAPPVDRWVGSGFPVADRAFDSLVSIPLYPTLTDEEQEMVCFALAAVVEEVL